MLLNGTQPSTVTESTLSIYLTEQARQIGEKQTDKPSQLGSIKRINESSLHGFRDLAKRNF